MGDNGVSLGLLFGLLAAFFAGIALLVAARAARVKKILNTLPSAVIVADRNGRIVVANRRALDLLGLGAGLLDASALGRRLAEARSRSEKSMTFDADGTEIPLLVDDRILRSAEGVALFRLVQLTDLTGSKMVPEEERRADRLEAVGTLAAGIAHEVKNPLSALAVNLQLLEENVSGSENPRKVAHYLEVLTSEVRRLNAIVDNFIDFARPRPMEMSPCSVEEILRSIITLVAPQCEAKRIALEGCDVTGTPVKVLLDESQIKRSLLNIVVNAIDSMAGGGRLVWGIEYAEEMVLVRITDTGGGIPEKAVDKIFDLFYTTKKGGSGLGLSLAQKAVAAHRGFISVKNIDGGACFVVGLPLARERPVSSNQ
ncbi:MAG: hypothetical protein A2Z34_00230 [Planctomycetes bacterium RBG_16_59_8]|nr:MAG: hypothetical protein A2Z34_00230 [Planctomycetes bacterium RBG_16_59_8]